MKRSVNAGVLAMFFALGLGASAAAGPIVTDFGTLGGSSTTVADMNQAGLVVGSSEIGSGSLVHAYIRRCANAAQRRICLPRRQSLFLHFGNCSTNGHVCSIGSDSNGLLFL